MARSPAVRRIAIGAAIGVLTVAAIGPTGYRAAVASSVGGGALVAAVALGLVLTHRSSGVVNFANAAMATYGAYVFTGLRRQGELFLPPLPNPLAVLEGLLHAVGFSQVALPDLPTSLSFGGPLTFSSAFALSLVIAALAGLLMHAIVFRPLRHAPPLAKTVASVGLLLVLQSVVVLRFTSQAVAVKPLFEKRPVHVLGTLVRARPADPRRTRGRGDRGPVGGLSLHSLRAGDPRRSGGRERRRAHRALTRAARRGELDDLRGARRGSRDPRRDDQRVDRPVDDHAAHRSRPGGCTRRRPDILRRHGRRGVRDRRRAGDCCSSSRLPRRGFHGRMVRRCPGSRKRCRCSSSSWCSSCAATVFPTRGARAQGRLPFAPAPTAVAAKAAIGAVVGVAALLLVGPSWRLAAINSLVGVVLCLSLVVLTGFVGQISLAQLAFAGIAGFTVSKLATQAGIGFPIGPLLGALAAMAIGLIAAVPALRVRGVNLAIVTFAAAAAVENLLFKNSALSGGLAGAQVPPPRFLGIKFGPNDAAPFGDGKLPSPQFGIFCLAVVIALAVVVCNLRRSATGRQLLAVRTNERAAAAGGISVAGAKLLAFALASFIAGIGGALSAYRFGSVSAASFGSFASIGFLAFAYLGGISSVTGAVIGGTLVANGLAFTALSSWFGVDPAFTMLLGGVGLILTAVVHNEGMAGAFSDVGRLGATLVRRRAADPPRVPVALLADERVA